MSDKLRNAGLNDRRRSAPPSIIVSWFTAFNLALGLLTRFGRASKGRLESLSAASTYFTLIGALVGLVSAAAGYLAQVAGLGVGVSALVVVVVGTWITRGLHEDGLADTVDGFGGGRTRDRKLELMRDSRVGTFGLLALMFVVLLRWALLTALAERPGAFWLLSVVAAASLSRLSFPLLMRLLPPARPNGLAKSAGCPALYQVAIATLVAAGVLTVALGPLVAGIAFGGFLITFASFAVIARRQIGGQTGDVLGATQQICEVAVLLAILVAARQGLA